MSCYNGNEYERTQDEDEHSNPFLNAYLDDTDVENDRYLINFIKGVMTQERAVKLDMIKVLKEQILVLRQELLYKQSIIDSLLRHYDRPCNHGHKTGNHGNAGVNPFSNAINMSHPMRFDEETTKKPVITLYSTSSPIPSPFPSNIVNNCNHGNKMHNASIASCLSNDSLSSLVSKAVDKYQVSPASCTTNKTKEVNDKYNSTNSVNDTSDITTDLTNWKHRDPSSQLPISKQTTDEDRTKNEVIKPLSETLLSVRNLIKSNIPPTENASSPRVDEPRSTVTKSNSMKKERVVTSKDAIRTQKTCRVKFNKNGLQTKVKKND